VKPEKQQQQQEELRKKPKLLLRTADCGKKALSFFGRLRYTVTS